MSLPQSCLFPFLGVIFLSFMRSWFRWSNERDGFSLERSRRSLKKEMAVPYHLFTTTLTAASFSLRDGWKQIYIHKHVILSTFGEGSDEDLPGKIAEKRKPSNQTSTNPLFQSSLDLLTREPFSTSYSSFL